MKEIVEILNSNFEIYSSIIDNKDISEHLVDEKWVEYNFSKREFYLLRFEKKYVGFISYQNLGEFSYIGYLYILSGEHHKGFGKKLIQFIEMRAMQDNIQKLFLFTNRNATWAIDFYQSIGFKIIEREKKKILTMENGILADFYEENSFLFQKIISPPKKLRFN